MKAKHAQLSENFLAHRKDADWHNDTLWFLREKRDIAKDKLPEWEKLRETASQIKKHTLSYLPDYLEKFEAAAKKNGMIVEWAWDGAEVNELVAKILRDNNVSSVVKSKSMLTEECGLNPFLEKNGFEVVDTDLGERIVQLRKEHPSHIVVPAVHLRKEQVSDTFHQFLNTEEGNFNPSYLAEAARVSLRKDFIRAEAAITGVNFGVASNGSVVVCTNEGNADLGVHSKKVVIHCMGIEKLVPGLKELSVFTRLLARSAVGQPITIYTSHYRRPRAETREYIIIVNNKRTEIYKDEEFREALQCIRCGACMNTCPVYRRSGGHSYHNTVPGPIGSVLAPFYGKEENKDLPFASTLCGSCNNVCPVKIDLAGLLYKWRQKLTLETSGDFKKTVGMKVGTKLLSNKTAYSLAGKCARMKISSVVLKSDFNPWNKGRVFSDLPKESFREWYKKNKK
ncbi:lactate utilization protein [Antarcticibacterium sp. 1MA-6-2]|uniref:lactate utilization protein B n=1 Tax=Antarcticibacterium sp. 1MA-6-2 TaxID=2908210 RepID=UPI001F369D09|nr:lactate utilization protein B [Antarcticibacterium sp. 1MA-6-2]UJH90715.1 lactate utilization protein [Antarcticibacterium sp. 1MA-6-2]